MGEARASNIKLGETIQAGDFKAAMPIYGAEVDPAVSKFIDIISQLIRHYEKGVEVKYNEIVHSNHRVKVILVTFGLISIVFCILISVVITRSITVPIQKNIAVAQTLADGNLAVMSQRTVRTNWAMK